MERDMESGKQQSELDPKIWQAALAGLLHDVGKFSRRAGRGAPETLDAETRQKIGYEHARASYAFVEQFVPQAWRAGLSGAAYHHNPQTLPDRWVQLADAMSLIERVEDEDRPAPYLRAIFSSVKEFDTPWYLPLHRLTWNARDELFPLRRGEVEWQDAQQKEYAALWGEFERACRERKLTPDTTLSPEAYVESLLAVLYEFGWCIPAASQGGSPDASLYDHARTTAALAACLAADARDEAWCREAEQALTSKRPGPEAALLVSGDVSGIQSFLYSLSSEGAAKSLRARSFYLELLCQVVAHALLDTLSLPLTNLLYVGGGNFTLLAPTRAAESLPKLAEQLTDTLLEAHRGALGLTLAWEPVQVGEFRAFNAVYDRLGEQLNEKKRQPFAQASARELAEQVGVPLTMGGALDVCEVTGDDWDVEIREGASKTGFVWSLEELGRQLPNATHLVLARSQERGSGRPHNWQEGLRRFGYDAAVFAAGNNNVFLPPNGLVRVWRLDTRNSGASANERAILTRLKDSPVVVSEHPIANAAPRRSDQSVLTFDELAEQKAKGIRRWGVLRMDVDNLGDLFQTGLGESASLSRLMSLSSGLRMFFEGWLPDLVGGDLKDKLYIQYSGGDDVFVVGAWDALPAFAQTVRAEFKRYTCENPAFTLSAGIAVVESKFPLYQAAQLAGAAEAASKVFTHSDGKTRKDAITFLGETQSWGEFAQTKGRAEDLEGWTNERKVSRALLQVIQNLRGQIVRANAQAKREGKTKPQYGRWMWMAAYQFTRIIEATKESEVKTGVEKIRESFFAPGNEGAQWGMAARWAQFLTREG